MKTRLVVILLSLVIAGMMIPLAAYADSSTGEEDTIQTGFVTVDGGTVYKNAKGNIVKGLKTIEGKKYYFGKNGIMKTGLTKVGDYRYYFSNQKGTNHGAAITGWKTVNGNRYFFSKTTNKALRGWQTIEGSRYFFGKTTGRMLKGFQKIDGSRYFLSKKSGKRLTGWVTVDGSKRYFSTKTGKMLTGWQTIQGSKYYLSKKTGKMLKGSRTIKGNKYYFSTKTGKLHKGWKTVKGGKVYYGRKTGKMIKGWHKIDGSKYYFSKKTGKRLTGWQTIKEKKYYFKKSGKLVTDKMVGKNKYVNSSGRLVAKDEIFKYQKKGMASLERTLRSKVKGYRGTWCVYVKDLDTNRYVVINNQQMHAASLIKLYVMGGTYERIDQGKEKKSLSVKANLKSMITVSSNDGHNNLVQKAGDGNATKGMNRITAFCKDHGYTLTISGCTLSPSAMGSHGPSWNRTSVMDCGHILEDIYRGALVSKSASKEMMSLLKKQHRRSKIPAGLPSGVVCGNKTGEVPGEEHDAAVVFSKGGDYIITVMTKNDPSAISHIRSVSRTVYNYFN